MSLKAAVGWGTGAAITATGSLIYLLNIAAEKAGLVAAAAQATIDLKLDPTDQSKAEIVKELMNMSGPSYWGIEAVIAYIGALTAAFCAVKATQNIVRYELDKKYHSLPTQTDRY